MWYDAYLIQNALDKARVVDLLETHLELGGCKGGSRLWVQRKGDGGVVRLRWRSQRSRLAVLGLGSGGGGLEVEV